MTVYFLLFSSFLGAEPGPESIAIFPPSVQLVGSEDRANVIVENVRGGKFVGVAPQATLKSSDENIVRIEGTQLVPVGDGRAKVNAQSGEHKASLEVEVRGMDKPYDWSFRNHIQAVLTKQGCNSGACHGALAGKKGFKLSLRGYDSQGDFDVLTRQAMGRRVNADEPGKSLLLIKGAASVPHGGGKRFEVDSREYRAIADWIAAGSPSPRDDDPTIQSITIIPEQVTLKKGDTQPFIVQARFSDGRVEDVTRWTKFTSGNAEVGEVSDIGVMNVVGYGQGAVSAWYLNKISLALVTVPYESPVDEGGFAQSATRNFIDEIVLAKLRELNLPPSPRSSDEEFLRRVYIDTIGTLPTPAEARQFLADPSPTKRDVLVDSLLTRPEFVDYWTYRWSDLFLVNSERLRPPAMWSYYHWIRHHVASNTPWDQFARDLVTATGSSLENGATNFFVLHQDPRELAETISVAFMGLSINCARCHNHPLERWTNDEYFGMTNMVARVRLKAAPGDGNVTVFASREGDIVQPLRGKPQAPRPLDGEEFPIDDPGDRRVALAQWLTSPDNPYFAKAIANRVWANFMNVGVVEPVDDLRLTNPPSNPALIEALAKYMVDHKYDVRALIRTILQSETYQRSSLPMEQNAADRRFYSRYYPRRLMAEVLIDAVAQVTGVPTSFPGYPAHWRTLQLPDSKIASYFLDTFGRPKRDSTCECERTNAPSMVQALHLANGESLNEKLKQPNNRVGELLKSGAAPESLFDEVYLLALCRLASPEQKERLKREWDSTPEADRRAFLEDLFWSILSSKEFLFNH